LSPIAEIFSGKDVEQEVADELLADIAQVDIIEYTWCSPVLGPFNILYLISGSRSMA
jgi:hypothetical protein